MKTSRAYVNTQYLLKLLFFYFKNSEVFFVRSQLERGDFSADQHIDCEPFTKMDQQVTRANSAVDPFEAEISILNRHHMQCRDASPLHLSFYSISLDFSVRMCRNFAFVFNLLFFYYSYARVKLTGGPQETSAPSLVMVYDLENEGYITHELIQYYSPGLNFSFIFE